MIRFRPRFLVRLVGHRGLVLLFFALLDFAYAGSLLLPSAESRHTPFLVFMAAVAPLWAWGLLWLGACLICLGSAFTVDDRWGFTAAMAVKVLWGVLSGAAAVAGVPRAWLAAVVWLCMAGWVADVASWPEPEEVNGGRR